MNELQAFNGAGIEFQMDAPEKVHLVLKRSVLGLRNGLVREEQHFCMY